MDPKSRDPSHDLDNEEMAPVSRQCLKGIRSIVQNRKINAM